MRDLQPGSLFALTFFMFSLRSQQGTYLNNGKCSDCPSGATCFGAEVQASSNYYVISTSTGQVQVRVLCAGTTYPFWTQSSRRIPACLLTP